MLIKFVKNYLKKRSKLFNALSYYNNEKHFDYTKIKFGSIGKNCRIHPDCRISDPDKVIIGDNVFIQDSTLASYGGLYIGNNVGIAVKCIILTIEHEYKNTTAIPYGPNILVKPVVINDNVWVGAGARIMPGVEIGEGAIVSMGSVVSKDVPPCAIVFGVPARVIGYRDKDEYEKLKQDKAFNIRMKHEKFIVPKYIQRRPNLFRIVKKYVDSGEMVIEE